MSRINTEEMNNVAQVFVDAAYRYVIGNMTGDTLAKVQEFVIRIVLQEKPYLLVTPEGLTHITKYVFGQKAHLDFVLSMEYAFFARWGGDDQDVIRLAQNLARGVSYSGGMTKELNSIPHVIYDRLLDYDDALKILQANKWLMIVLMMQLFITVGLTKFKDTADKPIR